MLSKLRKTILTSTVLLFLMVNQQHVFAEDEVEEKSIFAFLAPMLVDTLHEVVTAIVRHGANTLLGAVIGNSNSGSTSGDHSELEEDTIDDSVTASTPPFVSHEQAQILSQQPLLAISVSKYSSNNIDVEPVENISFDFDEELGFEIKTGEYFAVKFDTSTPGRVRLINTDASGKTKDLGLYEVLGAHENRMPRKANIVMIGDPGAETLDLEYTACVSEKLIENPSVAPYVGVLPMCVEGDQVAKSYKKAKLINMQRVPTIKGMHNPETEVNSEVALLATEYQEDTGSTSHTTDTYTIRLHVDHITP